MSIPDVGSFPLKLTESPWLYQPFESGLLEGVAVTDGPVSSYWKLNALGALVFPARSRQVPFTEAVASSGPEYVDCVQVSRPEVTSAPVKAIESVWLYQPA